MPKSQARSRPRRAAPVVPGLSQGGTDLPERARASLSQVVAIPGWAILPLRLFMGLTFIYAGFQKLTDPGFFSAGSPTYIGAQIIAYARHSPIRGLMLHLAEHATIIGALTIMTEIGIGTLVLLGILVRPAALVGASLNLVFFLSASWTTYPYFMGSDIVFVMCWLTLAITGAGALSLGPLVDPYIVEPLAGFVTRPVQRLLTGSPQPLMHGGVVSMPASSSRVSTVSRHEAVAGGLASLGLIVLALLPRWKAGGGVKIPVSAPAVPATPAAQSGATPAPKPSGSLVGNISQVPVNSALGATDPRSGDPAVIVHTSGSTLYAYDAVCTHAGCTVQYDPQYRLLVCPCHGGAYDPAKDAAVVQGPPPAPLQKLPITVDAKGNIYLG